MAVDPPDPRSVYTEFRFRRLKPLRIFDGTLAPSTNPTNLLAVSNKFGLVFVGSNKGIKAIKTVDIEKLDAGKISHVDSAVDYPYKEISIPYKLTHIALSSDDLTLAACLQIYKSPCAHLYDVRAFADDVNKIDPFVEVRLSASQNAEVVDYAWNPAVPTLFAVCLSDGSVSAFDIADAPGSLKVSGNLPPSVGAMSICWSPKGKQIVVGKQDGSMVQYKPDLQAANSVPAPTGLSENPTPVMSICWISNFLFSVTYQCDDQLVLMHVYSKGGQTKFVNYEDIFYTTSNQRRPYYYMFHQPDWHIIVCASSNANEVGVLGNTADDKEAWVQWILEDTGRAELPMCGKEETFPLGLAVDITSQYEIPLNETRTIPPMPILYLLTSNGLLCPFYMINTFPNTPSIVRRSEVLSSIGLRKKAVGAKFPSAAVPQGQNIPFAKTPTQVPITKSLGETTFPATSASKAHISQPSNLAAASGGIKTGMPMNSAVWKVMQPSASEQSPTSPLLNLTISRTAGASSVGLQNVSNQESGQTTASKPIQQPEKRQPIEEDFAAAIVEEIRRFKSELAVEMKRRSSEVAVKIGTVEELKTLKGSVESLDEFSVEIKKNLISVQNDTHTLGNMVLEAFGILEERKMCNIHARDPRLRHLLHQRPLDAINLKKLRDIVNLFMYLESQIDEVHKTLDRLAESDAKEKRLKLPSMEAVYNVVLNSSLILNGLAAKVCDLTKQTDKLQMTLPTFKFSLSEMIEQEQVNKELEVLADSLLKTKLSTAEANTGPERNTLSEHKAALLRNFFANRTVVPVRTRATDLSSRLVSLTPTLKKIKSESPEKPATVIIQKDIVTEQPASIPKTQAPVPLMTSTPFKFQFVPGEAPEPRIHVIQKPKTLTPAIDNTQPNIFTIAATKGKFQSNLTVGGIQVGNTMPDSGERKVTPVASVTSADITHNIRTPKELISSPASGFEICSPFQKSQQSAIKSVEVARNVELKHETLADQVTSDDRLTGEALDKKLSSDEGDAESCSGYEDVTPPSSPAEFINEVEYVEATDDADDAKTETKVDFEDVKPSMTEKDKITFSFKLPSVSSNEKLGAKSGTNLFFNPSNESGFKLNQGITTSFGQGFSAFGTTTVKPQTVLSTSPAAIASSPTPMSNPSAQSPLLSSILSSPKSNQSIENTSTPAVPSSVISFSFKQPSSPVTTATAATLPVASVAPLSSAAISTSVTTTSTPTPAFGSTPATAATIVIPQPTAVAASSFSFKSPTTSPATAPATGFSLGHLQSSPTTQTATASPPTGFSTVMPPANTLSTQSAANFTFSLSTISSPTPFGQVQPATSTATTVSSPAFATQGFTSTVPFKFESTSNSASSSSFGQSGVFGQKPSAPAFSTTGFGSSTGSAFGQAPAFGAFGQSQTQSPAVTTSPPLFGQQQPATSPGLGNLFTSGGNVGFFTGLGGKPTADSANKNIFGTPTTSTPAAPSPAPTNLFGGGVSTAVPSAKFGGNFSGGNFTVAGAPSVAQTGFGSFQQSPQKPANVGFGSGGFGTTATFGGGPKFGTSPTFGGTPSFGVTPTVTGGLFGNSQTTQQQPNFASFAASTTAPTFGSLAAQSTAPSFGSSVPQQQAGTFGTLPQQPPAFGTTGFGSPPAFGGNSSFGSQGSPSFNQWRS